MSTFETITVIVGTLALCATGVLAYYAHKQLKEIAASAKEAAKANTTATLATVVQIEGIIGERLKRIDEVSSVIQKNASKSLSDEEKAAEKSNFDGAVQNYLNAMDRLCACFLHGTIPEEFYKQDYVEQIPRTVSTYERYFGGANDHYHNILTLRNKWRTGA